MPGYAAFLFRRSFADFSLPGSLIDRAHDWLGGTEARWNGNDHNWTFPSGAILQFGYCNHVGDERRYKSSEGQFFGFDELTEFVEAQYRFLFSRLRRRIGSDIPLRFRAASNPGGPGHCVQYGMILTPNGWKDVRDFSVGDRVYTVADSGELRDTIVSQVHRQPYSGELVRVNARGLRMNCTPDHRVAKVGGSKSAPGKKFTLTRFNELPGQTTILRSAAWGGREIGRFVVPMLPAQRRVLRQPESLTGLQYAALMGWFLSEGCTVDRDKRFDIAQMKDKNRTVIRDLLIECGFKFNESPAGFVVHSPDWWNYLRQFGKCRDKFIPDLIRHATQAELQAFFTALMAGDGHWGSATGGDYYTTSVRLAHGVAEVAFKLGFIVSVNSRQREGRSGLSYCVSVKKTKSGGTELLTGQHVYDVPTKTRRRSDVETEWFEGDVYCIGVPDHHSFVIMQDGCVWVSGNSFVKDRFITDPGGRVFVPAKLADNPHIDQDSYLLSMGELDPVTRLQLLHGDWDAVGSNQFKREWFDSHRYELVNVGFGQGGEYALGGAGGRRVPVRDCWRMMTVDPAATSEQTAKKGSDPDYTVIAVWDVTPSGDLVWVDCHRFRLEIPDIVPQIKQMYAQHRPMFVAVEAVASNRAVLQEAQRRAMVVREVSPRGQDKLVRARPAMIMAQTGKLWLPVKAHWLDDVVTELLLFKGDGKTHDDAVDVLSYACSLLDEYDVSDGDAQPMPLMGRTWK